MNPMSVTVNTANKDNETKISAQTPASSCTTQDTSRPQPLSFVPNNETIEETSTRNEVSMPENRFKLKPEQSYKKETKASRLGKSTGRWTHKEHVLFIEGLKIYGKNWKKVESYIGTRTGTQIRSHAQKFFNRIRKEFSTEDPSKYVIDNMGDDDIRRIVREHCGDDVSNSNDGKDFSSDTPEVLFSISKEKMGKKKHDSEASTPRSIGASGSAFKSFKRQKTSEEEEEGGKREDSKIPNPNSNEHMETLIGGYSLPIAQPIPQKPNAGMDVNRILLQALLANNPMNTISPTSGLNLNNTLLNLLLTLNMGSTAHQM